MNLLKLKVLLIFVGILIVVVSGGVFVKNKQNEKVLGESDSNEPEVFGLVIPHHDLADDLIINAIERSRKDPGYEKIVIIGPNHYFPNSYFITTAEVAISASVLGLSVGEVVEQPVVISNKLNKQRITWYFQTKNINI